MNLIRIVRSRRRKKTMSARLEQNAMVVYSPCHISDKELSSAIERFKRLFAKRAMKKKLSEAEELDDIFKRLNREFFNGKLKAEAIKYSPNQNRIYGCCDFRKKKIRVSYRIAKMPKWVKEYVIIHEMAHLVEPNHSKRFWAIVNQYKFAERARGFLIAKGMDANDKNCE
ncbi:MAG: M48 family metallopeptidase [Candidatus Omnitrophota bacterium]